MIDLQPKKIIAFAPKYNTKGRKDATGAFIPEAKRFMKYHRQPDSNLFLIDNRANKRFMRNKVEKILTERKAQELDCVAFFCHGSKTKIQLGYDRKTIHALAIHLFYACCNKASIPLFSCDVGRDADRDRQDDLQYWGGDGGFQDLLRDELCAVYDGFGEYWGATYGHSIYGHTTRNPHLRICPGLGSPTGGAGGFYVVWKKPRDMWNAWRKLLRTDFRFEVPFLSIQEIHRRVSDSIK